MKKATSIETKETSKIEYHQTEKNWIYDISRVPYSVLAQLYRTILSVFSTCPSSGGAATYSQVNSIEKNKEPWTELSVHPPVSLLKSFQYR